MEFKFTKKITCLACTLALITTSITPVPAEELETESPSAGATKVIADYVRVLHNVNMLQVFSHEVKLSRL